MRYLSVCSGIGAETLAWRPLGWQPIAFSEIDAFASAVLAHHYPGVPNWGDMRNYDDWPDATVDLLCGGTPCQSFSVAGLRKGLDDPRGNLMLTFGAVAAKYRPCWLVWENVPGVLSSNGGRDFGSFLGLLGELGYGFAYRVLDAQYFGVAQRRRRVFVVGCLGDWRSAAAVLFERESLRGNPPPRREAGERATHDVAPSLTSSGRGVERTGESRGQNPVVGCWWDGGQVSQTLDAVLYKGQTMPEKNRFPAVLQPVAFDSRQDPVSSTERFGSLVSSSPQAQAVAVSLRGREGCGTAELSGDVSTALRASQGGGDKPYVLAPVAIQERAVCENPDAGPDGKGWRDDGVAYTLEARQVPQAVAFAMAVRCLTPLECERLQGLPDYYTAIPWRGRPPERCPDGPRYRAIGNAWPVPVVRWIGRRIEMVDALRGEV